VPLKMYFKKSEQSKFWENHWETVLKSDELGKYYHQHLQNRRMLSIFEKYLPREGKIIEGGCGLAPWVYVLKKKGYDVEGLDYAEKTINLIKRNFPELSVRVGNAFNLEYSDSLISGYISLGVVEHFEEGPQKILKEAHRVLGNDGPLICSVPYFNPLRRLKSRLGFYGKTGEFYQYAFTGREMKQYLKKVGFKTIAVYHYDPLKGLKDEIKIFKPLVEVFRKRRKSRAVSEKSNIEIGKTKGVSQFKKLLSWCEDYIYWKVSFFIGHMIIIVSEVKK